MSNRLVALAKLEVTFHRLDGVRWVIRASLFVLLVLAALRIADTAPSLLLGVFFLFLPFEILLDLFRLFLRQEIGRLEDVSLRHHKGMSYSTAFVLARSRNKPQHLWYYLLRDSSVRFTLQRLGVSADQFYSLLVHPPTVTEWLKQATALATTANSVVAPQHLFEVLQSQDAFQSVWHQLGISDQERNEVWNWYDSVHQKQRDARRGFAEGLKFSGGIGRDWTSGYTKALELFASDATEELARLGATITSVGHTEERKKIIEYLSRDHGHNVVLVGEEGIGKERLMFSLASDFNQGAVPLALRYKHMYILDTGKIISASSQNEIEQRLHAVFHEASTVGNVVMVIPDFQFLIGGQKSEAMGTIDAAAVVSGYLKGSEIQIIAVTTPDSYYKYIKPNATLEQNLLAVEVKEIHAREALVVLQEEVFRYEAKTKHVFSYQALAKVIEIAEQHVHTTPYPEKALQLLDEIAGAVSDEPQVLIVAKDVERILGAKLKVPLGNASATERDVLNNLEAMIRQRIIGQEEAIGVVANALRRARAGLHSGMRPIGSFLFLGPTGVGKTEMAKTIAALYYKNEKAFIRLDMSEYQTPDSMQKLIGDGSTPGLLTVAITDQPFSVVLLDEIEKADVSVRNLFLQVLDEGRVTDGYGKRIDFTNAMLVATSNAGAQLIRQAVQQQIPMSTFKTQLLEWLQTQGIFSPEWLNRFDAVVTFLPLTQDEILKVAQLQVAELVNRLKTHNIELTLAPEVYDILIQKGYDPQFGARPMRRAVQDTIESALAKALLHDTTEGQKHITITKEMLT